MTRGKPLDDAYVLCYAFRSAKLRFTSRGFCPLLPNRKKKGAENETRTRDPDLGKVVLYQLSYFRIFFFF